jgi:hypothetical protein
LRWIQLFRPAVQIDGEKALQFFSSLGEAFFHKSMKTFQILGNGLATGQTKNGGINLGTGIENLGWKLTDLFNVENGLQKNCDCAVVGCPGKCGVPIGHLLLQCDDNRLRRGGTEGELYKQGGGDGVRKISANEGSGWMLGKGFEGVAFDQLKTGFLLKFFA